MTTKVLRSATIKTKKDPQKPIRQSKVDPATNLEPICKLTVAAHTQPHISLGSFTANRPPKGFSIHINPDPEPDTIVAQIIRIDTEWKYELVLHIANYGDRPLYTEVWPL